MEEGSRLLSILLKASEKAANIARVCRQDEHLFKMLVQEKHAEEKNPRFFQDFKTLADVLIQETIRHDIEAEFPELGKIVQGEENNVFSNTLGETVIVQVHPTCDETASLLAKVMGGDETTAGLLAAEVHKDICFSDVPVASELPADLHINIDDLGIWIDPIGKRLFLNEQPLDKEAFDDFADSTADYINGGETIDDATGLHLNGLRCVTVLIGGYLKSTGLPVLGVVSQPFYTNTDGQWKGICYWGFVGNGVGRCSVAIPNDTTNVILLSRAEDADVKSKLSHAGYNLVEAAGAGYKILTVATGQADAYVLSKGSTYRWDTCAPQALLRSLGGGIVEFRTFVANPQSQEDLNLKYLPDVANFSNSSGLIAFRNPQVLESFKSILCE